MLGWFCGSVSVTSACLPSLSESWSCVSVRVHLSLSSSVCALPHRADQSGSPGRIFSSVDRTEMVGGDGSRDEPNIYAINVLNKNERAFL